jgi:hypothetical protein
MLVGKPDSSVRDRSPFAPAPRAGLVVSALFYLVALAALLVAVATLAIGILVPAVPARLARWIEGMRSSDPRRAAS